MCLRKKHKDHSIIDIEEHEKEVIMEDVTVAIIANLDQKVEILSDVKTDLTARDPATFCRSLKQRGKK